MKRSLTLFILLLMVASAFPQSPFRVAVSRGGPEDKYLAYGRWLQLADSTLGIVDLWGLSPEAASQALETCQGLMLTGGEDVDPSFYGKGAEESRCGKLDRARDTLEFALIRKALDLRLPIMAVCRGAQILNVALGGSLIIDIPADFPTSLCHTKPKPEVCFHPVSVIPGSLLAEQSGRYEGTINSYHHQAVDRLAEGLLITAVSPDGIIEAYTWKDKSKPLLIAVQWHPERMTDDDAFSLRLAKKFVMELQQK